MYNLEIEFKIDVVLIKVHNELLVIIILSHKEGRG